MLSSNRAEGTDSSSQLQLREGVFVSLTSDEWCTRRDGGERERGEERRAEEKRRTRVEREEVGEERRQRIDMNRLTLN